MQLIVNTKKSIVWIQAGFIRREVPFMRHVPEERIEPLRMEHFYFCKYLNAINFKNFVDVLSSSVHIGCRSGHLYRGLWNWEFNLLREEQIKTQGSSTVMEECWWLFERFWRGHLSYACQCLSLPYSSSWAHWVRTYSIDEIVIYTRKFLSAWWNHDLTIQDKSSYQHEFLT